YFALILESGNSRYTSDCTGLQVWPYAQRIFSPTNIQYMNQNSFQIVSAGPNGKFGRGSDLFNSYGPTPTVPLPLWSTAMAGSVKKTSVSWDIPSVDKTSGLDDQSNFYRSELGIAGGD